MQIAGLDFGRKRIGLAISDGRAAFPIGVVERRSEKTDIRAVHELLQQRQVSLVVVGLPLSMDGSEGPSARAARRFAERLSSAIGVPVELFDERLTSFEADERLRQASVSMSARKSARDAIAAAIILEGWLQAHGPRSGSQ